MNANKMQTELITAMLHIYYFYIVIGIVAFMFLLYINTLRNRQNSKIAVAGSAHIYKIPDGFVEPVLLICSSIEQASTKDEYAIRIEKLKLLNLLKKALAEQSPFRPGIIWRVVFNDVYRFSALTEGAGARPRQHPRLNLWKQTSKTQRPLLLKCRALFPLASAATGAAMAATR